MVIQCSAEDSNGAKLAATWYKEEKAIAPHPTGRYGILRSSSFFQFAITVAADTGTYTCVATNDAGSVKASMFLDVRSQTVSGNR